MELQKVQKAHNDPRYYYVRIMDLQMFTESEIKLKESKQQKAVKIKMYVGQKQSQTSFLLSHLKVKQAKQRINDEAHIFGYGGEEFMKIYVDESDHKVTQQNAKDKQKEKDKQKQKEKEKEKQKQKEKEKQKSKKSISGYCRILLPPLIQYPHICHKIKAKLVGLKNNIQTTKTLIGEISLELYYRLDFHASIQIIPTSGHLHHNVAQIGDMKPIIQIRLQNQIWRSLEADGIHPNWSGHFHAKKQNIEGTEFQKIDNIKDNVKCNRETIENRQAYHANNLLENKGVKYFDIARFSLSSASSFMAIRVYSFPMIGKTADITGTTEIRISNQLFFMNPQTQKEPYFIKKELDIFYQQEQEKKVAGCLSFLVRFIFDKNNVLDCGPYVMEMPKPVAEPEKKPKQKQKQEKLILNGENRLSSK